MCQHFALDSDAPITDFNDARNALSIVETLRLLGNSTMGAPFFVAQGFHRPHFPWLHPKGFEDYYPNGELCLSVVIRAVKIFRRRSREQRLSNTRRPTASKSPRTCLSWHPMTGPRKAPALGI